VEVLADSSIELQEVKSLDWSYDDQFIVIGLGGSSPSTPIKIYSFDGTSLTLRVASSLGDDQEKVFAVRWHSSNYFFAFAMAAASGKSVAVYEFDPGSNTITLKSNQDFGEKIFMLLPGIRLVITSRQELMMLAMKYGYGRLMQTALWGRKTR